LAEALISNTSLILLDLSGMAECKWRECIWNRHCRRPALGLSKHRPFCLSLLSHAGNQVGATGAARLAEALQRNSSLTSLHLAGTEEVKEGKERGNLSVAWNRKSL